MRETIREHPSLQRVAREILEGATLEEKLRPVDAQGLEDHGDRDSPPDGPTRPPHLRMVHGMDRLPKLATLGNPAMRAECLHRFANHELQAVELFAWAALKFVDTPWAFRQGLMRICGEEQDHLQLYLQALERYGLALGDRPVTGNFWTQVPAMNTPMAFVCAMGLTFESANLDFALLYRDAFSRHGATEEAAIMQRVHDEELGHVAWALSWVQRWKDPRQSVLQSYRQNVPFPLGLHRAKGRNFVAQSRRRAGLDEEFVVALRDARSPQQDRTLR